MPDDQIRSGVLMNKYQYLLRKKESGELSILLQIGVPTQVLQQMDIYAFHLLHPDYSQLKLANHLNTSQATVQRAIAFMSMPVRWDDSHL